MEDGSKPLTIGKEYIVTWCRYGFFKIINDEECEHEFGERDYYLFFKIKEEEKQTYTKTDTPSYYIGLTHKYEASKVIEDFQADSYNIGTAITYLLRAGKKVYVNDCPLDSQKEDIKKAIAHLNFELERL
jgi:isopenicillin N synthase-like dioxygenase